MLVTDTDDGLRDIEPGHCYYCKQLIGQHHEPDCVAVDKRVRVRYTIDVEIDVPHCWSEYDVESHRMESSWCANNVIDDLKAYRRRLKKEGGFCLCDKLKCEFLEVVDARPRQGKRVDGD